MSWIDRTRPTIVFTSPTGQRFTAKWKGNSVTREKKLGIFEFPKFNGTKVQDLGIKGRQYPLTVFFDGPDCDINAQKFEEALSEIGVWSINHPVKGPLVLQPVSITPTYDPTGSGNIIEVETNWMETIDQDGPVTGPELAASAMSQVGSVNAVSAVQFNAAAVVAAANEVAAIKAAVSQVVTAISKFIDDISSAVGEIQAAIESIKRGIDDVLNAVILQPLMLAGQIQQLIQLPSQIVGSVGSKLDTYLKIADSMFNIVPVVPTAAGRNTISVAELAYTAIFGALVGVVTSGEYGSRAQALMAAQILSDNFILVTNHLDETQELYSENLITTQYFSQLQSFPASAQMMYTAIAYLLRLSFNLPAEKRFTLKKYRAPIEITIAEYGSTGPNDAFFDLFITSNKLKANEIIILPPGREVVVYV